MNQSQTKSQTTGSSAQPVVPQSPISEMLQAIERALSRAHEEFSLLDNKVEPIRAGVLESDTGECSPTELMPTQMENQLRNIYDMARHLASRIEKTHSELRI